MKAIKGEKRKKKRVTLFILLVACYFILLYFFYKTYVPLIESFQIVLLPLVSLVFVTALINRKSGLYLFVFFFPLINTLPYFFGISESVPHAPTALVLFLFFFSGWILNVFFVESIDLKFDLELYKPLLLCSLVVIVSAGITFYRYLNFFPFFADAVYELKTNTIGVTAGGAVMSTVFFSLSYLTSFAFFFITMKTLEKKEDSLKLIYILGGSAFISFCVGIIQYFADINPGINPRILMRGYINATFKDSLSLGAFTAVVFTLFLGMFFYERKIKKIFFFALLGLSIFVLLLTGSKSGFLCLLAAVVLFVLLVFGLHMRYSGRRVFSLRNVAVFLLIGLFVFLAFYFVNQLEREDKYVRELSTLKRLSISGKKGIVRSLIDSRDHLWKSGILMMKNYPLTGVGAGAFIIELANYAQKHEISIKTPESAENYFVQAGAELGIIGLLIFIWIYWLILKRMWLQYAGIKKRRREGINSLSSLSRDGSRREESRVNYLFVGIMCGIIAYMINIQAHTYIGSYEIKYTFWLLVGLLFCLGRVEDGKEEKKREKSEEQREEERKKEQSIKLTGRKEVKLSKRYKMFGMALIVLYGGVHLWNSTHSLSLEQRTEQFDLKQNFGFYDVEKTPSGKEFRWTKKNSGMTLSVEKPVISISVHASHPDIQQKPVKVKIFIIKDFFRKKELLDEVVLNDSTWNTYEYEVPAQIGEEVILLFKVSRIWNPWKTTRALDGRNLGVAVGKIQFKEKGRKKD